jgi:diacylglycerol kinase family enzyme
VVHRFAAWRAAGAPLRRGRRLSYVAPIVAALLRDAAAPLTLETETGTARGAQCVITNVPGYALGLRLTPAAAPDDGRLDWLMLERRSAALLFAVGWAAWRGRHLRRGDVRAGQGTRLTLTSERPIPVQVDGDAWGTTPVHAEVLPGALTVIAPSAWS